MLNYHGPSSSPSLKSPSSLIAPFPSPLTSSVHSPSLINSPIAYSPSFVATLSASPSVSSPSEVASPQLVISPPVPSLASPIVSSPSIVVQINHPMIFVVQDFNSVNQVTIGLWIGIAVG